MHRPLIVHNWPTPNGKKIFIMLEELGLPYDIRFVDIDSSEQFRSDFLAISPNNKIPALVDHDEAGGRLTVFESGAILTYLADRHGRFLAPSGQARLDALAWLFWQVGGLGPIAIERYTGEVGRLLGVLEARLAQMRYLAGDEFSIADIAAYPWVLGAYTRAKDVLVSQIRDKPAIERWMTELAGRPGVQRGMAIEPSQGS